MAFRDHDEQTLTRLVREFRTDPDKVRVELKDDPDTLSMLDLMVIKHDPQEKDPALKILIDKAGEEALQIVNKHTPERRRGKCHDIWTEQKRILSEQGIDWKSPAEMNPHSYFD